MTGYMIPAPPPIAPNATVVAHGADAELTEASFGKIHTNTGAAGAVALSLPAAADVGGQSLRVQVTVAQLVKFVPKAGEKIFLGGSGVASKYAQIAGVIGNFIDIYSDGEQYLITSYSGVATKEA